MPRRPRRIEAGTIYHVLNRGNGRRRLFNKEAGFATFMKLLSEAVERFEVDLEHGRGTNLLFKIFAKTRSSPCYALSRRH